MAAVAELPVRYFTAPTALRKPQKQWYAHERRNTFMASITVYPKNRKRLSDPIRQNKSQHDDDVTRRYVEMTMAMTLTVSTMTMAMTLTVSAMTMAMTLTVGTMKKRFDDTPK